MVTALVFGTGAVGCIYACILQRGGAQVTAVCRTNYLAIKANGIIVRSAKWGTISSKPHVTRTSKEAVSYGPFDYVLVASKAVPGTSDLIRDAVSPQTAIVIAQNGIGIEDEYAQAFPDNTIISGIVYLPTTQVELGVCIHTPELQLFEMGTFPAVASAAAKAQVDRLSVIWQRAGANVAVFDDIQAQRWYKVALNAALNPISALTLCDDANLIRSSEMTLDMVKDVMREVGRIASADGYDILMEHTIDAHMKRVIDRLDTGGKELSMLTDIRHNRTMEVEAILGNVVRTAERLNVDAPHLRMLYMLASARNYSIAKTNGWKPIASID